MNEFEYKLELLKMELSNIENSIKKMDDLGNSTKNWSVIAWIGTLGFLLKDANLHNYVFLTILLPLVFLFSDAHWRRLQRRFTFRYNKISDYINGPEFTKAFKNEKFGNDFYFLDSFSRRDSKTEKLKNYISLRRVLTFPTVSLFYGGQFLLSIVVTLVLWLGGK